MCKLSFITLKGVPLRGPGQLCPGLPLCDYENINLIRTLQNITAKLFLRLIEYVQRNFNFY